jgi:hypothetical protein
MLTAARKLSLILILVSILTLQGFSQRADYSDSLSVNNALKANDKPGINYSVGSSFIAVPHVGSMTGFTFSPSFSIPLSRKWSVDGGIIAGRYYSSFGNLSTEGLMTGSFNELLVFGSASYHLNPQLTLYGIGTRQLTNTSPFYSIPKSSYAIGSNYNFGNFSVGVTFRMDTWDNGLSPLPFNGFRGFGSPYGSHMGIMP